MARQVGANHGKEHGFPFLAARPRGHAGRRHGRTMPYPPTRGAGQHPRSAPARLRSKDIMNPHRTLTKAELPELLFDCVGLNKREAKNIVESILEEIRESLARGVEVKSVDIGNFQVRDNPTRPG